MSRRAATPEPRRRTIALASIRTTPTNIAMRKVTPSATATQASGLAGISAPVLYGVRARVYVRGFTGDRVEVIDRNASERVGDLRVELRAAATRDLCPRILDRHRAAVRAVARHRVELSATAKMRAPNGIASPAIPSG